MAYAASPSCNSGCPGCSIGCNLWIDHHERVVYRFTPRENPAVNATWLCDHGRFLAESLDADVNWDGKTRSVHITTQKAIAAPSSQRVPPPILF